MPAMRIVLVTPAFPETGRTVYQGNLFVGSVPLNESPLKDHPLNPMHDSNLVRVLARQSKTKIGLVDLAVAGARAGRGSGAARRARRTGHRRRHHRCGVRLAIWRPSARWRWITGSRSAPPASGSGWRGRWSPPDAPVRSASDAMSRRRRSADRRRALPAVVRRRRCSRSPTPSRRCRCCISIPSRSSRARTKRGARWPGRATGSSDGPVLIACSSTPDEVAALQSRHGRDAAGHAIEQAMADIAEGLVAAGVRRLVVAGGETSGAVVDRLRIPGFLVGAEICRRRAGAARGRRQRRRDVACTEIGQFRRRGIFLRRARIDALRSIRCGSLRSPTGPRLTQMQGPAV